MSKSVVIRDYYNQEGPSGAFGEYIKISDEVGVKVLSCRPFTTYTKAKQSGAMRSAKAEYRWLKKAYKSKITPKPYGVKPVKVFDEKTDTWEYKIGILMQHIEGDIIGDLDLDENHQYKIYRKLYNTLATRARIHHTDVDNPGNVIGQYSKNGQRIVKYWLIDFTPSLVRRIRENKNRRSSCS